MSPTDKSTFKRLAGKVAFYELSCESCNERSPRKTSIKFNRYLPKKSTNGKMPSFSRYICSKRENSPNVAPQSCDTQFFVIYPFYIRIVFIISSCILLSHFSYISLNVCIAFCCGVSVYFMLCVYLFST